MSDSRKAGDSVTHDIYFTTETRALLYSGKAFNLFSSYFSKRYVLIQGINASTLPIQNGVPPGGDGNRSGQLAPAGLTVGSRFFDRPVKKTVKFSFLATKIHLHTNRNIH